MKCDECTTPTKYIVGLWDGANGTHGKIYDCHNLSCEIKQDKLRADSEWEKLKEKVIFINQSNGIDMGAIKAKRKELRITINKMALKLRIMCSEYSDYEMCRKPLPLELHDRIDEIFREYGRNK